MQKIKVLDERIEKKRNSLQIIKSDLVDLREQLKKQWVNYFAHLEKNPEATPGINISLPDSYKKLSDANGYDGFILLDKFVYKTLGKEIEGAFLEKNNSVKDISQIIKNKFETYIKNELNQAWFFIPETERASIIYQQLQKDEIQASITEHLLPDFIHREESKSFLHLFDTIQQKEIESEILQADIDRDKQIRNEYSELREKYIQSVGKKLGEIEKLLERSQDYNVTVEDPLKKFNELVDNGVAEVKYFEDRIEKIAGQNSYDINTVLDETDDLFAELNALNSQALEMGETITPIQEQSMLVSFNTIRQQNDDLFEFPSTAPASSIAQEDLEETTPRAGPSRR